MNRKAAVAAICALAAAGAGRILLAPPRSRQPARPVEREPLLRDLDGRPVRLSDLRGRIVLLSFFSGT